MPQMTVLDSIEARRPARNASLLGGPVRVWLFRRVQLFADLQVASARRDVKAWLKQRHGSIVEVGCGDQPYRAYVPPRCTYTAIDRDDISGDFELPSDKNVLYYSDETFPLADASSDGLFHTEVIEHVYQTRAFLAECRRVLKPGGEMFFTVPFQARYHYIPHDFFRFTPAALSRLLAEAGFADIAVAPRGNDITVAGYKIAAIGFRWAYGKPLAKTLFLLTSPITIIALLIAHAATLLSLGSRDDCLGYSVTASAAPRSGS